MKFQDCSYYWKFSEFKVEKILKVLKILVIDTETRKTNITQSQIDFSTKTSL